MESTAATNEPKTARTPRSARDRQTAHSPQSVEKTPESELMTVEEYFGILRKRVNDYYDSIQGQD